MATVLVAEDDPAQLQGLTAYLRHAGFHVHPAGSGHEALALSDGIIPDAAICDWNLGGGPDGADVVAQLQRVNPELVPILVTGNDLSGLRSRVRHVCGITCFAKPVEPEQLLASLAAAGCRPEPSTA